MKKTYTKPMLYAERFELVEHIASCNANKSVTTVNYRDRYTCSYHDGDVTLFNEGVKDCNSSYDTESFVSFDEYISSFSNGGYGGCYNAFTDGNFFAS